MRRLVFIPALLLFSDLLQASQLPPERFFAQAEKQVFTLKLIDATAGECELETLGPKQWQGRPAVHFRATLKTTGLIGLIYPYSQTVDLFLDRDRARPLFVDIRIQDRSKSQHTQIRLDEAQLRGEEIEDSTDPGADTPRNHRRKQWGIPKEAQSLWSILAFLRLQQLEPNARVSFPVAHDEKNVEFIAEVGPPEEVRTAKGDRAALPVRVARTFTDRFYPAIKEGPVLWFSNDARKNLLRFEFKHKIGKIFAVLKSTEL